MSLGVAIAALASLGTAGAHAQEENPGASINRLELSSDGSNFAPSLSEPLFPEPFLLVPGQSVSDSLWALNTSEETAIVSLYPTEIDSTLPESTSPDDDFRVGARTQQQDATSFSVAELDSCIPLAQAVLAPGEDAEITIAVALPFTSGNVSQQQSISVDFVVDLRPETGGGERCGPDPNPDPIPDPDPNPDPDPGPSPDPGPPGVDPGPGALPIAQPDSPSVVPDNDPLPRTGNDVLPLLLLGLVAIVGGAALRRAGREGQSD